MSRIGLAALITLACTAPGCGIYTRGIDLATGNNIARAEYKAPVSVEIKNNSMRTVVDVRVRSMDGDGLIVVGGSNERVLEQGQSVTVENIAPDRWNVEAVDERGWIQAKDSFYVKSGEEVQYVIDRDGWKRPPRASNE